MWILGVLGGLGLLLAIVGEVRGHGLLRCVGKPVASLAFLTAGAARWWGGTGEPFGGLICLALVASVIGDFCLLAAGTGPFFLVGMGAFLVAHLGYIVAFSMRGVHGESASWVLPLLAGVGLIVLRWLWPRLRGALRVAVPLYVLAVTAMLAMALLAVLPTWEPWTLGIGALLFFVSDALVARQRFVRPSPWNRIVGLPLYYGAQWLLVLTIP